MRELPFHTVDVFSERRFGGNPLAVVMADAALDGATMQKIAAEFNLAETTFVLPSLDPANTAHVRIFNRTDEMAFAGHPMVGTALVLARQRPTLTNAAFEIEAGIVAIEVERHDDGTPSAATIATPRPLDTGPVIAPEVIARVLNLDPGDIVTTRHPPILVSNGTAFVVAELTSDALSCCIPDLGAFREARVAHPACGGRFAVHVYCRDGASLRARMFAPLTGNWEDPATGSANVSLACLLLSLDPAADRFAVTVRQGVEMGRPSELDIVATRSPVGIVATLRGTCVPVMRGHLML